MRQKMTKKRKADIFWGYLCVAPLSLGLLLFLAAPLCFALYLSLTTYDPVSYTHLRLPTKA